MVRGGIDSDGTVIYIGRAFHEGDMIPAKVMPDKNAAYICYGGEEHMKDDFEVLRQGNFVWEFTAGGTLPEGAVSCGQTSEGELLYVGRAMYQGTQTPGKVQVSHGCLYIPFDGQEVSISEYEVLCLK
jgi:co-chaperonin GroES (HSP10)